MLVSFLFLYILSLSIPYQVNGNDSADKDILKGKKVALLGVELHGNLGDEMETTPLQRKLVEWGVIIHGFASEYLPDRLRIDRRQTRPYIGMERVVSDVPRKNRTYWKDYDAFIVAPGPSTYYHLPCQGQIPSIWFGLSLGWHSEHTYKKQKHCLPLVSI
jgi:hypothetical protein